MSHPLFQDLAGQVFGLLTIVGFDHFDAWKNHYYKCRCACSTEVYKRDTELKAGKFFTCGAKRCRFWEKVDKNGPVPAHKPELGQCWLWTGATKENGYGVLKEPGQKKLVRVHVYSWELHFGLIEDELWVLHHCDLRRCVRPTHLFTGTNQDNIDDMVAKGRNHTKRPRVPSWTKQQMRVEYALGGVSHPVLATRYGVSVETVGRILRGES